MAHKNDIDENRRDSEKIVNIFNQLSEIGKIQMLTYSTAIRDSELIIKHGDSKRDIACT